MTIKRILISTVIGFIGALGVPSAHAKLFVPDAEPWAVWEAANDRSTDRIDHGDWQYILDTYVVSGNTDGINRFDYSAVSPADRARLQAYLEELSKLDPRSYSRAEQRAYWINLYNALTVEVVLQHYPVKSIRKIHGGLLGTGPWKREPVTVAGRPLSLNDIEHRILRPIWRDPRIHYAVNCASLGCPNLSARAFTGANTEDMLDAAAKAYVNHRRGVAFDDGRLTLSSIYDWFDVDFGGSETALLEHIARYAELELAQKLAGYDGRIRYDYDWGLNEP